MYVQLGFCCFLVEFAPFEDTWINRLEVFNEISILFSIYFLYLFAGVTPDVEITDLASRWLIFYLYGVLCLNFATAIGLTIVEVRHKNKLLALIELKKR